MRTSWPTSGGGIPQGAKLSEPARETRNASHKESPNSCTSSAPAAKTPRVGPRLGNSTASKKPTKRRSVRHLIHATRPIPLPIGPLLERVRWSLRHYPERNPESWVLQPTLRGPVWRYERWADRHKDIYAVAVLGSPSKPGDRGRKAVPKSHAHAPPPDDPT